MSLELALQHHLAGQFPQAETIYRRLLDRFPNEPDALHLLGVLYHQQGRHQDAVGLITRAISLRPASPAFYTNLGEVYRALGRLPEAIDSYHRALHFNPNSAEAWSNLSAVLVPLGRFPEAAEAGRRAVALRPDFAAAHANFGDALLPTDPDKAFASWQRAVQLDPTLVGAHCNMGLFLSQVGRTDEAIAACRRAIQLRPELAAAHANLSIAYERADEIPLALEAAQKALSLDPNLAPAWRILGVSQARLGQIEIALASIERCLSIDPNEYQARIAKAMLLLTLGDFPAGWAEYENRWNLPGFVAENQRTINRQWVGQDLAGKSIVTYPEQGLGDTIQFIRYARFLADRGAVVIAGTQPSLSALIATVPGVHQVVSPGQKVGSHDYQVNLMSLSNVFKTTIDTIPGDVPYITAPADKTAQWRDRLSSDSHLKVGVSWAGSPGHRHDRTRSCPLRLFAPLASVPGVTFYSLQLGPAASQAASSPIPLVDYTADLKDFTDTAAFMMNLDLVITVDTAAGHLAGALARPVWNLLSIGADFRWLTNRSDTPWYPTMRLFRQPAFSDWPSVLNEVAAALRQFPRS